MSKDPESEQSGSTMGKSFARSSPNSGELSTPSRAFIALTLPSSVLISPLWHMKRFGCARSQDGKVLVLKRECTMARCDSKSAWVRSVKNGAICLGVSMPL